LTQITTEFPVEGVVGGRIFCQDLRTMSTTPRPTKPGAALAFVPQRPAIVAKFRGALTLPARPERFRLFGSQAVAIW